ncbi:MAG: ankyrin repeat domain-containing protein [Spirochaetales bacterium]|nr:ankyrin repeat domain-containing protein [Spirochaetales bacterium]
MDRSLFFPLCFVFICLSSLSLFAEPDGDIRLSMEIAGWSPEGHFGWVETVGQGSGEKRLLKVVDLVTDKVVFKDTFEPEERAVILSRFGIEPSQKGTSLQGHRLVYQGVLYEVDLFSESDRVNVRMKNIAAGTYKEVNTAPLGGDEMEIKGTVVSPYEKRAALVFLRKGQGRAEYVVMGAHLTLGFRATPLEQEPLIESVLNGQYYISRLILEKGTDPDSVRDDRGYTPLLLAARVGNWEIVRLLLDYGARFDVSDEEGLSPADYARRSGRADLAALMTD